MSILKKSQLIICFLIILLLVSCSKTDDAKNVDLLISEIGEVSIENVEKIMSAEEAYNNLPDNLKEKVSNYDKLMEYMDTLENIEEETEKVEKQISNIGEVDINYTSKISKARESYENLDEVSKKFVDNYEELVNAEKLLNELKIAHLEELIDNLGEISIEDYKAVTEIRKLYDSYTIDGNPENYSKLTEAESTIESLLAKEYENIESQISNLGTISLDSEAALNEIQKSYDALVNLGVSPSTKISNWAEYNDALKTLKNLKHEETVKRLEPKFYTDIDKVNKVTFYFHNEFPVYTDQRVFLLPYIGKYESGEKYLITSANFTGPDWIFWESIIISVDGINTTLKVGSLNTIRDNSYPSVWEYYDFQDFNSDLLVKIANSNETIIRFQGRERQYDHIVPDSDKVAILETLEYYDALK